MYKKVKVRSPKSLEQVAPSNWC